MISPPRSRWRQARQPNAVRFDLAAKDRFTPGQRRWIVAAEVLAQTLGGTAAVLRHGLPGLSPTLSLELGAVVVASLLVLVAALFVRHHASLARETFRQRHAVRFGLVVAWIVGSAVIASIDPAKLGWPAGTMPLEVWLLWSDVIILLRAGLGLIGATRGVAAGSINPALVLVGTFAALITVGTLLLLLPKCRSADAPNLSWSEQVRVAAFTATSASCVTGLVVVPTGGPEAYWSRTGQGVILGLIQVGGLGIMTCGAFFALTTSRSLRLREAATLRELFDPDHPVDVRRLLLAILGFTFGIELVGALLLSGMWADRPLEERAFFSGFYAISAYCNAGFDLTGRSFLGEGERWQVWGVLPVLVIAGGLGFGTLYNLAHAGLTRLKFGRGGLVSDRPLPFGPKVASGRPARLTVSTRLILVMTLLLLVIGTAWHFFFEATTGGTLDGAPLGQRLADAWFQSVVSRTAGFNTVDLAELRPATKLVSVVLMFIGAAPVSTAGGVKVTAVAVAWLAIVALCRGRPRTEAFGRTIPGEVVMRALTVIAVGGTVLMAVTLLLAAFEDDSKMATVDLMYEAASACGTVGVSTGITPRLTPASQVVLMLAMFLGRVGPLTLLLGLAGHRQTAEYEYPDERVTLG